MDYISIIVITIITTLIIEKYIHRNKKFKPDAEHIGSDIKFTIECTMKERWVPYFLAMLKHMEVLGNIGSSRKVTIYADGDGDFHPNFEWDNHLSSDKKPARDNNGDVLYDAG